MVKKITGSLVLLSMLAFAGTAAANQAVGDLQFKNKITYLESNEQNGGESQDQANSGQQDKKPKDDCCGAN